MNVKHRLLIPFIAFYLLLAGASAKAIGSLPDFTEIVEDSSPAVVKIIVERGRAQDAADHLQEIPEYLRRFFEFRGVPPQGGRNPMAMGSGFIISSDGYIVTNNHVVDGAEKVVVRLSDRRELDADIIGADERSDLALLKIKAKGLPTLKMAKNDDLKVGEWVLAIGSPFGLDYSVTAGIVSAMGRSLPTASNDNYVPFIQTDVAINPGNSGGPLFNLDGEVVGVNSQIYTRSGGSIGLSFAIPVSVVRNVVEQLKSRGHVTRGWLGVSIQNVDKALAQSFGLKRPHGALVAQVMPGSPAEKAGIESGDVIVSFDGAEIETSADLPHIVGLLAPDTLASVELVRKGKKRTLKVKVGGLGGEGDTITSMGKHGKTRGGRLGLVVETAPEPVLQQWNLSDGVLVREVTPGSAAARAGIVKGDVITMLAFKRIRSAKEFTAAAKKLKAGESVPMRLVRRGNPLFIGITVKE
ncbi:MAG: serine peptidase [Gammaproteobacteria bacterium]|nr:MAG: serine peptidase [Gammaproteobacteria bacterium]